MENSKERVWLPKQSNLIEPLKLKEDFWLPNIDNNSELDIEHLTVKSKEDYKTAMDYVHRNNLSNYKLKFQIAIEKKSPKEAELELKKLMSLYKNDVNVEDPANKISFWKKLMFWKK